MHFSAQAILSKTSIFKLDIHYKTPEFNLGNWKFISLVEDLGANMFTNDIWKFFEGFDDEYFIYGGDDCVAVDKLDLELLDDMRNIMENNLNVMKICVTSASIQHDAKHKIFKQRKDFNYCFRSKYPYHV